MTSATNPTSFSPDGYSSTSNLSTTSNDQRGYRLTSIDMLRGLVLIINGSGSRTQFCSR